jgi:hypothetical protein
MATASTAAKVANYTPAQEQIILDAVRANGNVANLELAEKLAKRSDMRDADGNERKARGITAKMSRMKEAHGFTYERKAPTTKDGKPVTKKTEIVGEIAKLAGVTAERLDALDKASKGALEILRDVLTSMSEEIAEREAA